MRNARGVSKGASPDEGGSKVVRRWPAGHGTRNMPAHALQIIASYCLFTTPMPLVLTLILFIYT